MCSQRFQSTDNVTLEQTRQVKEKRKDSKRESDREWKIERKNWLQKKAKTEKEGMSLKVQFHIKIWWINKIDNFIWFYTSIKGYINGKLESNLKRKKKALIKIIIIIEEQ